MRALSVCVLSLALTACTLLFPVDDYGPPAAPNDAGDARADRNADASLESSADGPATSYPREVLADSPVVYLRLGDKSGSAAHNEVNSASATYGSGAKLGAPGAIGGDSDTAVTFTGAVGSSVTLSPGFDFAGRAPFSVEFWALETASHTYAWIVDHQVYGSARSGWGIYSTPSSVTFERWDNNQSAGVGASSPLPRGRYQYVVGTYDGTNIAIYLDGRLAAQTPSTISMSPVSNTWSAGAQDCTCANANFTGSVDELAVYDKALSADRIAAHYKAAGH